MVQKITILFLIQFLVIPPCFQAEEANHEEEFDVNLEGYRVHVLATFYQLGHEITPLDQLYLQLIAREGEWIREPRLYIKDDHGYFHLYKQDGTNVLYEVRKHSEGPRQGMWAIVDVKRKKINRIPVPKKHLQQVLIERLINPISTAIDAYYGESKLWYRGMEKVLEITKDERGYKVTVQVVTFEGPHNPPYGEETITFHIYGHDVDVIDYKHRDIPREESLKLKLR